jgi:hypothetical protein
MKSYYRVMLGRGSEHAAEGFAGGYIGTDFEIEEDLSKKLPEEWRKFNEAFIPIYMKIMPDKTKIGAGLAMGALWTVSKGIKVGDIVLSPDGQGRYRIAEVTGEYQYAPGQALFHRRPVRWLDRTIDRVAMSEALQRSTGSIGTVCQITKHGVEIETLLGGIPAAPSIIATTPDIEDPAAFALEKHLEDFLVENWNPMGSVGQRERLTQNRIVRFLTDQSGSLRWRYLGNWEAKEDNDNVERDVLVSWLTKRGYASKVIHKALYELEKAKALGGSKTLYEANREVYRCLRYGIKVSPDVGESKVTVWLIDWKNPEKNDFAIAEEVTVSGVHDKRPDLVLYVNGIALGVLELKRSTVSVAEGIRQNLDSQKPEFIRPFYATVQLVLAGNDTEGLRYGVIETPEKYYLHWKEPGEAGGGFEKCGLVGAAAMTKRGGFGSTSNSPRNHDNASSTSSFMNSFTCWSDSTPTASGR